MWVGLDSAEFFERALRLNPRDPRIPFAQAGLAFAHVFSQRYEKAANMAATALRNMPHYPNAMLSSIAASALAGRVEEARDTCSSYLKLNPAARISNSIDWGLHTPENAEMLAKAYRIAGMPE